MSTDVWNMLSTVFSTKSYRLAVQHKVQKVILTRKPNFRILILDLIFSIPVKLFMLKHMQLSVYGSATLCSVTVCAPLLYIPLSYMHTFHSIKSKININVVFKLSIWGLQFDC